MSQLLTSGIVGGGGTLLTLTASAGGAVGPTVGGTIKLLNGTNINTVGTPGTNQVVFNLIDSPTCAGTITGLTLATSTAARKMTLNSNTIETTGTDVDVDLRLVTKGVGDVVVYADSIVFDGVSVGWASSEWTTLQKTVQTVDATPTNIYSIALGNSIMITVSATINGIQDDYTDVVGGTIIATAYRTAAGNIALVGSPIINVNYSNPVDTSDIDAIVTVGTQSLDIRVIGVAAQNWNWVSTISYMYTISNA